MGEFNSLYLGPVFQIYTEYTGTPILQHITELNFLLNLFNSCVRTVGHSLFNLSAICF